MPRRSETGPDDSGRACGGSLTWRELPAIPANASAWNDAIPVGEAWWRQIGLAGPIAGVHGDYLLVGGGANLPEPGRTTIAATSLGKVYWNELFVLDLTREVWLDTPLTMPAAVGYAATVSLPEGVLVIGGEGFADGPNGSKLAGVATFADVFLMRFDPARQEVAYEACPPLPAASSSGAAALLGRTVYYQTGKDFLALDVDNLAAGWQALPAWPGAPRDTAVAAAVGGKVLIATGRTQVDGVWRIHRDAFAFDPATGTWETLPDMPFPAMAGAGFGVGNRLVIVGGDKDVARWDLVTGFASRRAGLEAGTPEWEKLGAALQMIADHHVGFNTEILAYDIEDGAWSVIGRFPGPAPVTTQPVVWQGQLILPSGEVRPGVRSPKVWIGDVDVSG
ncbi:hypothetical protein [Amaricoccus sp.]|uniref:hypothetical protein n=1 Tax=Amaricoccus sp. TaxID=1872485 RepID=UPI001B73196D|nr:hypothetical protein [Amaricoccus sp.]MBP7242626.1 hypothetical protein [Amaricoccus sp.]